MKKIKKNLKWITLTIVMIIIIGIVLVKYSLTTKKTEDIVIEELELNEESIAEGEENTEEQKEEIQVAKNVYVDIKGAVKNPGVYEIAEDKKVIDVVGLAGGFKDNADTSLINLAKKVANEMVIIIYTTEEVKKSTETETVVKIIEKECVCPEIKNDACLDQKNDLENNLDSNDDTTTKKVNINSATIEELQTLSGIGESKAKAIIEHREVNGNFEKIEDLMEVAGIGESLYEKIKDDITV